MFKHAQATNFIVHLKYHPELFTITFTDNGKGFLAHVSRHNSGIGLTNMKDKAKLLGAALDIVSKPKSGCRTSLKVPVNADVLEPVYDID